MAGKKKEEEKVEVAEEDVKTEQVEEKEPVKAEKTEKKSDKAKTEEQSFDEPEQAAEDQGPSKLPDLKEVAAMAKTMYCALKGGVQEVVANYKAKRADTEDKAEEVKK